MALGRRLRYEILKRDNHTCRYCGATAPDVKLAVDHVTPVALGGTDKPENLVASCVDCNSGKTSTSPTGETVADVEHDAFIWAGAIKAANKVLMARRDDRIEYVRQFENTWFRTLPWNHAASLEALYAAGLPLAEMLDAAEIALEGRGINDRFVYFCGVAWKKLGRIQDVAKELILDARAHGEI